MRQTTKSMGRQAVLLELSHAMLAILIGTFQFPLARFAGFEARVFTQKGGAVGYEEPYSLTKNPCSPASSVVLSSHAARRPTKAAKALKLGGGA